ncbi:hypothetical protein B0H14DRAFT_2414461, partial [Mycena olivaceomarginata]
DRARIVDAICAAGGEILMHRSRCLEAVTGPEEHRQIVACMRYGIRPLPFLFPVRILMNSKALDCEEEVCLLMVSELLWAAPATTLVNKHASHMWKSTSPSAALACHETGSLVTQVCNPSSIFQRQDGIIDELLAHGTAVFSEVAKSQWGFYCIQHILEHGSEKHRQMALEDPLTALLEFTTNEQVNQSVVKALKEGGKETLDRGVQPAKGYAVPPSFLSFSRLTLPVVLAAKKDRCAALYDCLRAHTVPLRACKTGYKVIWLLYVHPIQFILKPTLKRLLFQRF